MERKYIVDDDGCWIWTGAFDAGRPVMKERGKKRGAARVLYEKHHGFWVDRRANVVRRAGCNPKCVNPEHGKLQTNAEINEAFLDTYGGQRRRKKRESAGERIAKFEEDRKKFRPLLKKR